MEKNVLRYHLRLKVYRWEADFGPGVALLMSLIDETGSVSAACREMGMAYSKAFKILNRAQEDLGFELVTGARGGSRGGKTVLTEEGKEFLRAYEGFEAEVRSAADQCFQKYFSEIAHRVL